MYLESHLYFAIDAIAIQLAKKVAIDIMSIERIETSLERVGKVLDKSSFTPNIKNGWMR